MTMRRYEHERDREQIHKVLREVNWLPDGEEQEEAQDAFSLGARGYVAELSGLPECYVTTMPGTYRYQQSDLSLCCVTGVCTSRVARKQGLAGRLTAMAVAECAADGAEVAGLGVFDQGFYNLLGFGTGVYEYEVHFDPADLTVTGKARVPVRLSREDYVEMHEARTRSFRRHGSATVGPPDFTRMRVTKPEKSFGLGYRGDDGRITHHFWCHTEGGPEGPWGIAWVSYETYEQLTELFLLIKGLGDQVRTFVITQPPQVQMQDILQRPLRTQTYRAESKHKTGIIAKAYWQLRINDVAACIAKTHAREEVAFNLRLTDPIERYLDDSAAWRGVGGEYVVTLGAESSAVRGAKAGLPVLDASVNAFTRMWLGVRPATTLAVTDDIKGEGALLARLDEAFMLPAPHLGWFF